MFFWIKRKEIVLDCFTYLPSVYELAKPDFSYKFFPEWFLKLPKEITKEGRKGDTLKSCRAFKDIYSKNTITIPSSFEVKIKVFPDRHFEWALLGAVDETAPGVVHPPEQTTGMYDENLYQHFKFPTAWTLKTNKFVNFVWLDMVWNRREVLDYCVLPGIVDYKYQPDTMVNIIFKYRPEEYTITIPYADPVAMLAPMEDCSIKIKHHLETYKYVNSVNSSFYNPETEGSAKKYTRNKRFIDNAEKRDAMTKCPFGR
jgi:hypothetical protein